MNMTFGQMTVDRDVEDPGAVPGYDAFGLWPRLTVWAWTSFREFDPKYYLFFANGDIHRNLGQRPRKAKALPATWRDAILRSRRSQSMNGQKFRTHGLLPGDILLYRGENIMSKMIRFIDSSEVSHASFIWGTIKWPKP